VARRPAADDRQPDFFAPARAASTPRSRPVRQPKPRRAAKDQPSPADRRDIPGRADFAALAARLCRAEMAELAAALSDEALAHLVIAAVRQLRRRLARSNGRGGRVRAPALERAVQQLVGELGGQDGDEL